LLTGRSARRWRASLVLTKFRFDAIRRCQPVSDHFSADRI